MENTEKKQGLVFNMAMPYLLRVDKLLSIVSGYSINENYRMMKHSLRALFRELNPYISDGDNKILEARVKRVRYHENKRYKFKLISENNSGYLSCRKDKPSESQIQQRRNFHNNKVIFLLDDLSMRLMNQTHKLGLLIPLKKDRSFIGGGD